MKTREEQKPTNIYNHGLQRLHERVSDKEPIYKGCPNGRCFCTGACKEIVGWMPKAKTSIFGL